MRIQLRPKVPLRDLGRSIVVALIGAVLLIGGASAAFAGARGDSPADPQGAALDPGSLSQIASGVVLIRGFSCTGARKIIGTGFLVGRGVVLTARRVVDPGGTDRRLACRVKVRVDGHWIAATKIGWWYGSANPTGRATDLATLKLAEPASPSDYVFGFRNSSPPVGTNLSMLGHRLGNKVSLTQGRLLAKKHYHHAPLLIIDLLGAEGRERLTDRRRRRPRRRSPAGWPGRKGHPRQADVGRRSGDRPAELVGRWTQGRAGVVPRLPSRRDSELRQSDDPAAHHHTDHHHDDHHHDDANGHNASSSTGWPWPAEGRTDGTLSRRPERQSVPDHRRIAPGTDRRPDGIRRRRSSSRTGGRTGSTRCGSTCSVTTTPDAERTGVPGTAFLRSRRPATSRPRTRRTSHARQDAPPRGAVRLRRAARSGRDRRLARHDGRNGVDKVRAYGQYLGRRYEDFPNIIWMHGNDYQDCGADERSVRHRRRAGHPRHRPDSRSRRSS